MRYKILFFLFLVAGRLYSQDAQNQVFFHISYFGILGTHPGLKIGLRFPLLTLSGKRSTSRRQQIVGSPGMILYFHRRNQVGTGVNFEIGYSDNKPGKTNKEVMMGLGYLRTFVPNRLFDPEDSSPRSPKGINHLIKTVSIGFGKSTGRDIQSDFWMIKPTLLHIKPYNTGTTINFAVDAGYYFQ